MRVVLETEDLLEILSLHLGRGLKPEQVTVRLEPTLEIEIDGAVAVGDVRSREQAVVAKARAAPVQTDVVVVEDDNMSMNDLLNYSRNIEKDIRNLSFGRNNG